MQQGPSPTDPHWATLGEQAACATGSWKCDKNNKNIGPAPSSKSHENLNLPDPVTVFRQKTNGGKTGWFLSILSLHSSKSLGNSANILPPFCIRANCENILVLLATSLYSGRPQENSDFLGPFHALKQVLENHEFRDSTLNFTKYWEDPDFPHRLP